MEDSLNDTTGNTKQSPTIGIIGGKGQIGGFFANLFLDDNLNVLISDLDTEISNVDLVHQSDIVIISVPIDTTISVIQEIAPFLSADKLVIDMTSVKSLSSKAMCLSKADVIGIHPMFNPSVGTIEHQTVILTPSRDRNGWLEKIKDYLASKNVKIKVTTAEHHDHMMSLIQVLIHYNSISIGITMAKMGFDIHETLEYTSPIYRMELAMIGRIFAQNGRLYGNIPMHNPYTQKTLLEHKLTLEEMSKIILTKDLDAFTEKFTMASDFFNDFKAKAMVESNYLIKQLVKYSET
jgi:prephenate dehydrogenase